MRSWVTWSHVIDDERVGTASSSSSTIIGRPKLADEITLDEIDLDASAAGDARSEFKLEAGTDFPAGKSAVGKASAQNEVSLDEDVDIGDSSELNLVESSIKLSDGSEVFAEALGDDDAATGDLGGGVASDDEDMLLDAEEPSLHLSDEDLELSLGSSSEISLVQGVVPQVPEGASADGNDSQLILTNPVENNTSLFSSGLINMPEYARQDSNL